MTAPRRSSPITEPSALIRDGPSLCPAPVLSSSQFLLLGVLPCTTRRRPEQRHWPGRPVGATGSHVPCKSLSQARATSTPDAIWAVNRLPPDSSRDSKAFPVSTSPQSFDTSSVVRFRSPSWLTPAALIGATFPVTLTTTTLDRSSSRWFAASACTAAAEGHRTGRSGSSISRTATHSESGSSTSSLLQRSWHTSGRRPSASVEDDETIAFAGAKQKPGRGRRRQPQLVRGERH